MDAKLLANMYNSQYCWMLHVASVWAPCCMMLDVVACCYAKIETSQTFQPTTPNISFLPWSSKLSATMLDPFAQLFQHCWGRARSLHMVYKDLWVVSFPRCTAGPNIVGSCCIRLHTTANTHATTLAQQCWELLHAPVGTQPKKHLKKGKLSTNLWTMKAFLNILKTCLLCVSLYTLLEELIFYHYFNLLLLLMATTLFVTLDLRNGTPYLII